MISNFIYKHKTIIGIGLVILIALGAGLIIYSAERRVDNLNQEQPKTELTIDIEGAVKNPGIYNLKSGSLIEDAINIAGGLADSVDSELMIKEINRAEELKNNQKILIPTKIETDGQIAGASTQNENKININNASLEQLDSLPGIGPVYAQRIIDYRAKKSFSSIEEIMEIQGIGEKTFEKFKDLIAI